MGLAWAADPLALGAVLVAVGLSTELWWLGLLAVAGWWLWPYLQWRATAVLPLEAFIARTSFQFVAGELVNWRLRTVVLSVIIPAYNEERRLPQMLDEMLAYLRDREAASNNLFTFEVIVVDDGSRDATFEVAVSRQRAFAGLRSPDLLRVVQLKSNSGKGFAARLGMLMAKGQLMLLADADGSTRIRDIERLELALQQHSKDGLEVVFGSRHHVAHEVQAGRGGGVVQRVLDGWLALAGKLLIGGPIWDARCGFKLFRAPAAKQIFASVHLGRWAFDLEVLMLARWTGHSVAEVPVTFTSMPGSKLLPIVDTLRMLRDLIIARVLYLLGLWRVEPVVIMC